MDIRAGTFLAATSLLLCSACGPKFTPLLEAGAPEPIASVSSTPSASPFSVAPTAVSAVAAHFVRTVCTYRATASAGTDFLRSATQVATPREAKRLASSQRARLNWRAMRVRRERASLRITGVTQLNMSSVATEVVVEFIRTTHTDFATVREFAHMSLGVVQTGAGPRIASAEGACL